MGANLSINQLRMQTLRIHVLTHWIWKGPWRQPLARLHQLDPVSAQGHNSTSLRDCWLHIFRVDSRYYWEFYRKGMRADALFSVEDYTYFKHKS